MKVVSPLTLFCAGILLAVSPVHADTVKLKSGEVVQGKILSENDQEIVMDAVISSGITDQKTFPKTDVLSFVKTPDDEVAFQTIQWMQVESRSLSNAAYTANIKSLEAFLKQFPKSAHAAKVKETVEALKKEQARVKVGELKWNNRWYTAKEAEKNKYQLWSQMILGTMKEQAARRDFIGALNSFDRIETNYPGSSAYPEAVELAQSMVRIAGPDADRIQANAKAQEAQFNSGIVLVPEPQKSQMIAARQAQIASAEASLAAADVAHVKWKPLLPISSKSFEILKTTLSAEAPRIEKIPVAAMRDSITAAVRAQEELDAKNPENAEAKIVEAEKLWKQNEHIPALKAGLASLKESLKPKPTPTPAHTPTPAASPTSSASPSPATSPAGSPKKETVAQPSPKH